MVLPEELGQSLGDEVDVGLRVLVLQIMTLTEHHGFELIVGVI